MQSIPVPVLSSLLQYLTYPVIASTVSVASTSLNTTLHTIESDPDFWKRMVENQLATVSGADLMTHHSLKEPDIITKSSTIKDIKQERLKYWKGMFRDLITSDDYLIKAAETGYTDIVKALMPTTAADIPYEGFRIPGREHVYDRRIAALRVATRNGHTDIVRLLLSEVDYEQSLLGPLLFMSIERNHIDVFKVFVADRRVNVLNDAITVAAAAGSDEFLKVLMNDPRTDPGVHGNVPLSRAVSEGHLSTIELLLTDQRVSVNYNLLSSIIKLNQLEVFRIIMASPSAPCGAHSKNELLASLVEDNKPGFVRVMLSDQRINLQKNDKPARRLIKLASKHKDKTCLNILLGHPRIPLADKNVAGALMSKHLKLPINKLIASMNNALVSAQPDHHLPELQQILLSKFFWWSRLEVLHKVRSKKILAMDVNTDPLALCMDLE